MRNGAGLCSTATPHTVRCAWFRQLLKLGAFNLPAEAYATNPVVLSDPGNALCQTLLQSFTQQAPPAYRSVTTAHAQSLVRRAFDLIALWRPGIAETVSTLCYFIVVVDVESGHCGGASQSDHPGVIWLRPGSHWGVEEVAESLLHETVHQALFLEDAVFGLFEEAAFDNPPSLPSAVRSVYPSNQEPIRTFWASYHALCVARWLSAWFTQRNPMLAAQFQTAVSLSHPHLWQHQHLLTRRGQALLSNEACTQTI
ncbi:aKG-HExxH-type peptide beta-hydroxylase [Porticoccus sp.]